MATNTHAVPYSDGSYMRCKYLCEISIRGGPKSAWSMLASSSVTVKVRRLSQLMSRLNCRSCMYPFSICLWLDPFYPNFFGIFPENTQLLFHVVSDTSLIYWSSDFVNQFGLLWCNAALTHERCCVLEYCLAPVPRPLSSTSQSSTMCPLLYSHLTNKH